MRENRSGLSDEEASSSPSDSLSWFHRQARQIDPHLRLRHALKDPSRPLRHLRSAIRGVAEYGPVVREACGVSCVSQLLSYLPMAVRYGHGIDEFYLFRLYSSEWRAHAGSFLPNRRLRALDRRYAERGVDVGLLLDKARFAKRCAERGLPAIPTILELDATAGPTSDDSFEISLPPGDLIVKPTIGMGGEGVRAFTKIPNGYRDEDGRELAASELIDGLRERSGSVPLIVQPRLRNAPEISAWSPGALCSVRLVTTRRGSEHPVPLTALFRMPVHETVTDNMSRGGIASVVDIETGRLSPARAYRITDLIRGVEHERHPATAAPIAGCLLPRWDDVIQLGLRAHLGFGGFHSIGWDIAICEDGPVLIEGNHDWGARIIQMQGPAPLGWTRLPDDIRSCFENPVKR